MRIVIILLFIIMMSSCQNSTGKRIPSLNYSEMSTEVIPYLREGVYEAEYYASQAITIEQKQLLQKFSKLIETNDHLKAQFNKHESGTNSPYNSKMGLSRQEIDNLIDIFTYKAPKKSNGTLTISRLGNLLTLKGEGRLSLLDSVSVNTDNISALYKDYTMSRTKESIDLSSLDIPKGDTLENYQCYRGPDGVLSLIDLNGSYELLIGKLKPSGRIYLSFFAREPGNTDHPLPEYVVAFLE